MSENGCVCGCHLLEPGEPPERLPRKRTCAACDEAIADGYGSFLQDAARA